MNTRAVLIMSFRKALYCVNQREDAGYGCVGNYEEGDTTSASPMVILLPKKLLLASAGNGTLSWRDLHFGKLAGSEVLTAHKKSEWCESPLVWGGVLVSSVTSFRHLSTAKPAVFAHNANSIIRHKLLLFLSFPVARELAVCVP